jgi:hypothetical protein
MSVPATRRRRKEIAKEPTVPQNRVFSRYKCASWWLRLGRA